MSDFTVLNGGSIFVLTPVSEAAKAWAEEKISQGEETQYWGNGGIVVEHRYICDIIDGIKADDLTVEAA
jgi:hypothetical protein